MSEGTTGANARPLRLVLPWRSLSAKTRRGFPPRSSGARFELVTLVFALSLAGKFLILVFVVTTNLACTHTPDVYPVAPHVLASVEEPCAPGVAPGQCLVSNRPSFEVRVPDASSVQWARLSADGGVLVASVKSRLVDGCDISSVVAFDLRARRELWRVRLTDRNRPAPSDCFILPSGVALVIPGDKDLEADMLDAGRYWLLPELRTLIAVPTRVGHALVIGSPVNTG